MRNQNLFICPREQGNLSVYSSRYLPFFYLTSSWPFSIYKLLTFIHLSYFKGSTQNLRVAIRSSQVIAWTNQKKEESKRGNKKNLHCFYLRHFPAIIRSWSWAAQDQPRSHLFLTQLNFIFRQDSEIIDFNIVDVLIANRLPSGNLYLFLIKIFFPLYCAWWKIIVLYVVFNCECVSKC